MPVEIKELVIRMNATTPDTGSRGGSTSATAPPLSDQEALVEACVKQVLKILEKKKKR